MKVLIDADACPITDIAIRLCAEYQIACVLFCDTAHELHSNWATTIVVDKGADSADFALLKHIERGDLVVTQDYGLASMCLALGAVVLHQDGWEYTQDNMGALLSFRHASQRSGAAKGGPRRRPKRTKAQNHSFFIAFCKKLRLKTDPTGR